MKTEKELLDEYHTEIMVQTCRGVPGANFTEANRLYLELSSRLTLLAPDVAYWLCKKCGAAQYKTFDHCGDCNTPRR